MEKQLKQLENKILNLDVNSPNLIGEILQIQNEIDLARKNRIIEEQFKVLDLYVRGKK